MDSNTTGLTHNVLHAEEAIRAVSSSAAGGVTTFLGTTRDNFDGKEVISLEYEAYQPMALKEMQKLCERARAKWPQLIGIAVLHRLGSVSVGEASVVVSVSAPHRKESIDACHYIIDELKATVPIWKKEVYKDGSMWKQNAECIAGSS